VAMRASVAIGARSPRRSEEGSGPSSDPRHSVAAASAR
jgi:hypothetical protein